MTVKLLYFSWVRELTGIYEESIEIPQGVETISDLITWLKTRGPEFAAAFERGDIIRAAVNQIHVGHDKGIEGAHEIAFFPPVTGG